MLFSLKTVLLWYLTGIWFYGIMLLILEEVTDVGEYGYILTNTTNIVRKIYAYLSQRFNKY